jgi:hypothetical protein
MFSNDVLISFSVGMLAIGWIGFHSPMSRRESLYSILMLVGLLWLILSLIDANPPAVEVICPQKNVTCTTATTEASG